MITVRIIMKSHQLSSPRTTNEECLISEEQEVSQIFRPSDNR